MAMGLLTLGVDAGALADIMLVARVYIADIANAHFNFIVFSLGVARRELSQR